MKEPKMRVKDRDLRQLIVDHGAGPGTDLYRVLVELQERRDRDEDEAEDAEAGPGHAPAAQGPRTSPLL